MPMPLGGALSIACKRKNRLCPESTYDHELEKFRKRERYIQSYLKCTIELNKEVIPPDKSKIDGVLVLEARKDIEHTGIFILMKGLPVSEKKKKSIMKQGVKPLTELKFPVLESTFTDRVINTVKIEGGSTETYPVELNFPDELPAPLVSAAGRLLYRMHVCIATSKKRRVRVGETSLMWQMDKRLSVEDIKKEPKIEQEVHSKRALMGLGWRKSALVEWKVRKGGYLPGEKIQVELWGECKEKDGLEVECKLQLVQKVWYQVPSGVQIGKMYNTMKINVLASDGCGKEEVLEVLKSEEEGDEDEPQKNMLWRGKLRIPMGTTPTVTFDFLNSVGYTIRASVGVAGEGWVTGEVPILIGTSKDEDNDEDGGEDELDGKSDEDDDNEDNDVDFDTASMSQRRPSSPCDSEKGAHRARSGSTAAAAFGSRRSYSMGFIPSWAKPRTESVSSMQSLASSTLSIFTFPPSHSQLSRRSTLEILPPAYRELGSPKRQITPPLRSEHEQTENERESPDMSNPEQDAADGAEEEEEENSKETENIAP